MNEKYQNFNEYQFSITDNFKAGGLQTLRRRCRSIRRYLLTFILLKIVFISLTLVWHFLFSKHYEDFDWTILAIFILIILNDFVGSYYVCRYSKKKLKISLILSALLGGTYSINIGLEIYFKGLYFVDRLSFINSAVFGSCFILSLIVVTVLNLKLLSNERIIDLLTFRNSTDLNERSFSADDCIKQTFFSTPSYESVIIHESSTPKKIYSK